MYSIFNLQFVGCGRGTRTSLAEAVFRRTISVYRTLGVTISSCAGRYYHTGKITLQTCLYRHNLYTPRFPNEAITHAAVFRFFTETGGRTSFGVFDTSYPFGVAPHSLTGRQTSMADAWRHMHP